LAGKGVAGGLLHTPAWLRGFY